MGVTLPALQPYPYREGNIVYPESDGKPMADNTKQWNYIAIIKSGCEGVFLHDPNVFVAADLLWYPVQGNPHCRIAPDVMVVFGRPKGDRGSYLQWLEENIPVHVAFEVLSPKNTSQEMEEKRHFYLQHGVQEYYEYDPDNGTVKGWERHGGRFVGIREICGWVSPLLGVRFGMEGSDLVLVGPDGRRFVSYVELARQRDKAEARAKLATIQADRAEARADYAEAMARRAKAEVQVYQEAERAAEAKVRIARLEALLRQMGVSAEGEET